MATRVAQWAFAAFYLIVAVIAVWGGFNELNPPLPDPSPFDPDPLPLLVNGGMVTAAMFYFLTALAFGAVTFFSARDARASKDGALTANLNLAFAAFLGIVGGLPALVWRTAPDAGRLVRLRVVGHRAAGDRLFPCPAQPAVCDDLRRHPGLLGAVVDPRSGVGLCRLAAPPGGLDRGWALVPDALAPDSDGQDGRDAQATRAAAGLGSPAWQASCCS